MESLVAADLILGGAAVVGGMWLARHLRREAPLDAHDQVAVLDIGAALRTWGAASLLLGLLAVSGLPGGFDLPIWSALALGLGATAAAVIAVRWRWEGWALRGRSTGVDRNLVESETWQFGWVVAGATALVTYFIGLAIGSMQPVHMVVAMLDGICGYAVGIAIWTPQAKVKTNARASAERVHARPTSRRPVRRKRR